jgi:hypothetical protein
MMMMMLFQLHVVMMMMILFQLHAVNDDVIDDEKNF